MYSDTVSKEHLAAVEFYFVMTKAHSYAMTIRVKEGNSALEIITREHKRWLGLPIIIYKEGKNI